MPGALAILAVALLYLALFAPAAIALVRPRAAVFAGAIYAVFFLALAVHYFGLPGLGTPVALARTQGLAPRAPEDACAQAIQQAEQSGVIKDRSATAFVTVDGTRWRRLPADARVALTACLDHARAPADQAHPIRILQE
jgi:membrane protein implicated in regulation of membrane protease activity